MSRCKTCGYLPSLHFPSRIPTWACDECQAAYEDACERLGDEMRDERSGRDE